MGTTINNSTFTGPVATITNDPCTSETVLTVAQALLNLTELFIGQNIKLALLNVEQTEEALSPTSPVD